LTGEYIPLLNGFDPFSPAPKTFCKEFRIGAVSAGKMMPSEFTRLHFPPILLGIDSLQQSSPLRLAEHLFSPPPLE